MSEQSQPEATEAEAPEGAAPALSHEPILGDRRTDVRTVSAGGQPEVVEVEEVEVEEDEEAEPEEGEEQA
jgi:hypothetical protein